MNIQCSICPLLYVLYHIQSFYVYVSNSIFVICIVYIVLYSKFYTCTFKTWVIYIPLSCLLCGKRQGNLVIWRLLDFLVCPWVYQHAPCLAWLTLKHCVTWNGAGRVVCPTLGTAGEVRTFQRHCPSGWTNHSTHSIVMSGIFYILPYIQLYTFLAFSDCWGKPWSPDYYDALNWKFIFDVKIQIDSIIYLKKTPQNGDNLWTVITLMYHKLFPPIYVTTLHKGDN